MNKTWTTRCLIGMFLFLFLNTQGHTEVKGSSFNVLNLMADARPISELYQLNMTIKSPYKVVKATPYYYSRNSKEIVKYPTIERVFHNMINYNFERIPDKDEFIFFHLEYGPQFIFNRLSEAICFAPIYTLKVVEDLNCNTYTTTQYLLATAEVNSQGEILSPEIIEKMMEMQSLKSNQSWQNYQSILTFTLNHISENPEYHFVNIKGNYLKSMVSFAKRLRNVMLQRRRITLSDYNSILTSIDRSMVNTGYRILISMSNFAEQNKADLEFVYKYPTYMQDFFSGLSPFKLIEPESMSLPNVEVADGKVKFLKWPWFDHVKVSFDKGEEVKVVGEFVEIPKNTSHVYLRPYSKKGKYLRTIVQVGRIQDKEELIVDTGE